MVPISCPLVKSQCLGYFVKTPAFYPPPTLFFRGLPSRGEGGTKVKRKHSERVRRSHFPHGVRRRPECGVTKIGRGGGKLILEEAQELPGSVLGCEASPTSGKADMDTISILLGKCGLGLEV